MSFSSTVQATNVVLASYVGGALVSASEAHNRTPQFSLSNTTIKPFKVSDLQDLVSEIEENSQRLEERYQKNFARLTAQALEAEHKMKNKEKELQEYLTEAEYETARLVGIIQDKQSQVQVLEQKSRNLEEKLRKTRDQLEASEQVIAKVEGLLQAQIRKLERSTLSTKRGARKVQKRHRSSMDMNLDDPQQTTEYKEQIQILRKGLAVSSR